MYPLVTGMNLVHVSGLPVSVTEDILRKLFDPFGQVISARVLRDLHGVSLGCGMVEMSCREEVDEILTTKDRISVGGKRPNIWLAKEHNPPQQQTTEVSIRWQCHCTGPAISCRYCKGKGYCEHWIPVFLLSELKGRSYIIKGRRKSKRD